MKNSHFVADYIKRFFYKYLKEEKGLSNNTLFAYRDAIKLLLRFSAEYLKKKLDKLTIEDLDIKVIFAFLNSLENQRGCSISTRNLRLAAIRTFFDFIAREEPMLLSQCRNIRSISQKKVEYKMIDYLDKEEMKFFLNSIDYNSPKGIRDKAMCLMLYNTGARVQEIVNLKISDLRLDTSGQVKLLGKGNKQRACPLWPETIEAIKKYINYSQRKELPDDNLFLNANNKPITRFGIGYLIKKYARKAAEKCPSINSKTVGPHTFRHSTAMHLIQSGNDINMVSYWLGHSSINTTHIYIEIDMEMKRKMLDDCESVDKHQKSRSPKWLEPDILQWLNDLSKVGKVM